MCTTLPYFSDGSGNLKVQVFMVLSFDEDLERSSTSGRGEDRIGGKPKSKRQEKQEKKAKKRELAAQLRKEVGIRHLCISTGL